MLRYNTLKGLYKLTELTRLEICKRLHISPSTLRRYKNISDVPESLLYKLENLAIYKRNRKPKSTISEAQVRQYLHEEVKKNEI